MEEELTEEQLKQCYEIARKVSFTLKRLGHKPRSCIMVAALLTRGAAKSGRALEAVDAIKELLLVLESKELS